MTVPDFTAADLPTDAEIFTKMLPSAERVARRWKLDPGAAQDAVTEVVVVKRYQERWNPDGKGTLDSYLYAMVLNRLRDRVRALVRLRSHESVGVDTLVDDDGYPIHEQSSDDAGLDRVLDVSSLVAMRASIADIDLGYDRVGLLEVFDTLARRALAHEPVSSRAVGAELGINYNAIGERRKMLRQLLEEDVA